MVLIEVFNILFVLGYIMDVMTKTCNITDDQSLTVTNIHIERPFLSSYGSTTSDDFIRLASYVEHKIMTAYSVNTKFIRGIKVVNARKGSVNLDIMILHPDSVTAMDAYKHFIEAVVDKDQSLSGRLKINCLFTPQFVDGGLNDVGKSSMLSAEMMTVAILVPAVFIIGFILVVILVLRGRTPVVIKPTAHNNMAIELEKTS